MLNGTTTDECIGSFLTAKQIEIMIKEDLVKEFDRLIEAHYSEEIDSRDEWLREIIWLKDEVVKKLTIHNVVEQSEQLECNCTQPPFRYNKLGACKYCGKQKKEAL